MLTHRFFVQAIGPEGGSRTKTGIHAVQAYIFHEMAYTSLRIDGLLKDGVPHVEIYAFKSDTKKKVTLYEGPLDLIVPDDDSPCECLGTGFLVMNREDCESEGYLGEIQRCDCGLLPTDDDAIEAARKAQYGVSVEGYVTSEPCSERARRRWAGPLSEGEEVR